VATLGLITCFTQPFEKLHSSEDFLPFLSTSTTGDSTTTTSSSSSLLNPYRDNIRWELPDTGQTLSYTDTVGEDHDYTINPPDYTDNLDGTITDNVTGLMWEKDSGTSTYTWENAKTHCNDLPLAAHKDWRLPTREELRSIVDYGQYASAINTTFFPNTQSGDYWSSTTYWEDTSRAWRVSFRSGSDDTLDKTSTNYVRCTR
jgi:hypothetical protein